MSGYLNGHDQVADGFAAPIKQGRHSTSDGGEHDIVDRRPVRAAVCRSPARSARVTASCRRPPVGVLSVVSGARLAADGLRSVAA